MKYIYIFVLLLNCTLGAAEPLQVGLPELNKAPRNISLIYGFEMLVNNKKSSEQKVKLLWDFQNKRCKIIYLKHWTETPNYINVEEMIIQNGKACLLGGYVTYSTEKMDIEEYQKEMRKWKITGRVASIEERKIDDKVDYLASFFYGTPEESYSHLLNLGNILKKNDNSNNLDLIVQDSANRRVIFGFDKVTGYPSGKTVFSRIPLRGGILSPMIKTQSWKIKKIELINGIPIPLELECEAENYSEIDDNVYEFENKLKISIWVDKRSIKVNQNLTDSDFSTKIPVGSVVFDHVRGITYTSDGISGDPNQENLTDALESVLKIAEEQKKNAKLKKEK